MKREDFIRCYKLTQMEKVLSLVLLVIGIGMFFLIFTNKSLSSHASVVNNPGFFPKIVASGFLIMSVVLFLSSLDKKRTKEMKVNWFGFLIVAVWVVFGFLCNHLGFVISGILALSLTLFLFGVRKLSVLVPVGILAPIAVYIVLGAMMGVRLPTVFL